MAKSAAPTTRVRDPEGTRRKILAAALQEFAAKGVPAAKVIAIKWRMSAKLTRGADCLALLRTCPMMRKRRRPTA